MAPRHWGWLMTKTELLERIRLRRRTAAQLLGEPTLRLPVLRYMEREIVPAVYWSNKPGELLCLRQRPDQCRPAFDRQGRGRGRAQQAARQCSPTSRHAAGSPTLTASTTPRTATAWCGASSISCRHDAASCVSSAATSSAAPTTVRRSTSARSSKVVPRPAPGSGPGDSPRGGQACRQHGRGSGRGGA